MPTRRWKALTPSFLITEWNEFRALDLDRVKSLLRQPVVIDLRNIYHPDEMIAAGFTYHSIGRPSSQLSGEPITENARRSADHRLIPAV